MDGEKLKRGGEGGRGGAKGVCRGKGKGKKEREGGGRGDGGVWVFCDMSTKKGRNGVAAGAAGGEP